MFGMRHAVGLALVLATVGCQPAAPPQTPAVVPVQVSAASAGPQPVAVTPAIALPPRLEPPRPVRVGVLGTIGNAGVYIGLERGYYQELGLEPVVETIPDPSALATLLNTNLRGLARSHDRSA